MNNLTLLKKWLLEARDLADGKDDPTQFGRSNMANDALLYVEHLEKNNPDDDLIHFKNWVVEQRNLAHINCLEEAKQAYNNVLVQFAKLLNN